MWPGSPHCEAVSISEEREVGWEMSDLVALTTAAATADVTAGLGAVAADVAGSATAVARLGVLGTVGALAAQVTLVCGVMSVSVLGWEEDSGGILPQL